MYPCMQFMHINVSLHAIYAFCIFTPIFRVANPCSYTSIIAYYGVGF